MKADLIPGTRALAKGCLARVDARPGRRIECVSGSVWVTQDGDPRDVILAAGEAFDFDRRTGAIVSALYDARFLILDAVPSARPAAAY